MSARMKIIGKWLGIGSSCAGAGGVVIAALNGEKGVVAVLVLAILALVALNAWMSLNVFKLNHKRAKQLR